MCGSIFAAFILIPHLVVSADYQLTTMHTGDTVPYSNITQVECLKRCSKPPSNCCGFSFTLNEPWECRNFMQCHNTGKYDPSEPFYLKIVVNDVAETSVLNDVTISMDGINSTENSSPTTDSVLVEPRCEDGWILGKTTSGDRKPLCYKAFYARGVYSQIIDQCPRNSVPAPIFNDEQNNAVIKALNDPSILQYSTMESNSWAGTYIGLRDMAQRKEDAADFRWLYDNSSLDNSSYKRWAENEPSSRNPGPQDWEACVGICINGKNYTWNDYSCEHEVPIIGVVCAMDAI